MNKKELKKEIELAFAYAADFLSEEVRFPSMIICEDIDLSKCENGEIQGTGRFSLLSQTQITPQSRIAILETLLKEEKILLKEMN
jgi:hypothetical protein